MLQYIAPCLFIAAAWCLNSFEELDPLISELLSVERDNLKRNMDVEEKATVSTMPSTAVITTALKSGSINSTKNSTIIVHPNPEHPNFNTYNFNACPEDSQPQNLGAYEVPSQKDLALHVRAALLAIFSSYNQKAMEVLWDMTEAAKAAMPREEQCPPWAKETYRRCVRQVRNRCVATAKGLLSSLEALRLDVRVLIEGKICNISTMNTDPIQLIRILAAEKVSLEFALPGFLRLLNGCAVYCSSSQNAFKTINRQPLRKLTDQDVVIRHFLTRKGLSHLLKKST